MKYVLSIIVLLTLSSFAIANNTTTLESNDNCHYSIDKTIVPTNIIKGSLRFTVRTTDKILRKTNDILHKTRNRTRMILGLPYECHRLEDKRNIPSYTNNLFLSEVSYKPKGHRYHSPYHRHLSPYYSPYINPRYPFLYHHPQPYLYISPYSFGFQFYYPLHGNHYCP